MNDSINFSDLSAIFINCSLKQDSNDSHTMRLMQRSAAIMRREGVNTEMIHALDLAIPFGMKMDMTEHGDARDDWPALQEKIEAADILVLGTPIWLGAKSSVASLVIERMYAYSGETNDRDQYIYYGKTAGCVVTGNEDGVKACARDILYAMQHIGYTIPPAADCGWIGEIGPGPSYGDPIEGSDERVGYDSDFTNKNTTIMSWNLMHTAKLLRENGGFPQAGNQVGQWRHVTNAADQNPEYR